jgi:hypothetical protein
MAFDAEDCQTSAPSREAVDVLLAFACAMVRAGNTASRARDWISVLARKMGFDAVSVNLSIEAVTVSVARSGRFSKRIGSASFLISQKSLFLTPAVHFDTGAVDQQDWLTERRKRACLTITQRFRHLFLH